MTVVQPNSIAGINSISVQSGQSLSIHKSDGTLIREIVSDTGISTFSSISVGSATTTNNAAKSINIGLGASIAQHTDNSLSFGTNGDERLRIDSGGRIGIGIAPAAGEGAELSIKSSDGQTNVGLIPNTNSESSQLTFYNASNDSAQGYIRYDNSSNSLQVRVNLAERLRIDSSGNVLIGDSAGQIGKLSTLGTGNHISASRHSTDTSAANVILAKYRGTRASPSVISNGDDLGNLSWYGYNGSSIIKAADITAKTNGTVDGSNMTTDLTFSTTSGNTNTERLRIDSSGRLLLGTTTNSSPIGWNNNLQVAGTSAVAGVSIRRDEDSTGGALLVFGKSRGSLNGNTIVQSGDQIGGMYFAGADGTDVNSIAAQMSVEVDGTPGGNDMPGRILFKTTADGAASPTERLRITSDGQIGVNKTSPKAWNASYTSIQIQDAGYIAGSTDDSFVALGANNYLDTGGTYDYTNSDFASQLYQVDGTLVFRNAPSGTADNAITWTNRLSINVSGNATFAGTVSDSKGDLRRVIENEPGGAAYQIVAADAGKFIHHNNTIKMPDSGTLSIGDMVTIYAYGALTLDMTKPGGGEATVYNAADASTGDRTFAARSLGTLLCVAADTYVLSGAGIS